MSQLSPATRIISSQRVVSSKCKVMFTDWTGSITPLTLSDEELDVVDSLTHLGSCINASGNITDEITSRISRTRAVFGNLRHLWRRMDISSLTKGSVYNCTVRPTLIYDCETWPIRAEDLHWLQVFDHRCLGTIGHICWKQKINKEKVRQRIFRSTDKAKSLADIIQQARLRWLGHVLRMDDKRLTQKVMLDPVGRNLAEVSNWHRNQIWRKSRKTYRLLELAAYRVGALVTLLTNGWELNKTWLKLDNLLSFYNH